MKLVRLQESGKDFVFAGTETGCTFAKSLNKYAVYFCLQINPQNFSNNPNVVTHTLVLSGLMCCLAIGKG